MRLTKAEQEADKLLTLQGVTSPPVDVGALATELGIEVREDELDQDLSAVLHRRRGRPLILLNQSHHENRRRFSIAHELGHFLLHTKEEIFVDQAFRRDSASSLGIDHKEIQANQFAASLLMPRDWIFQEAEELLGRRGSSAEQDIQDLANRFRVSKEAMNYRLANLGIIGTV